MGPRGWSWPTSSFANSTSDASGTLHAILVITEDLIPFVVKGLRTHGGRCGFLLAEKLQPREGVSGL